MRRRFSLWAMHFAGFSPADICTCANLARSRRQANIIQFNMIIVYCIMQHFFIFHLKISINRTLTTTVNFQKKHPSLTKKVRPPPRLPFTARISQIRRVIASPPLTSICCAPFALPIRTREDCGDSSWDGHARWMFTLRWWKEQRSKESLVSIIWGRGEKEREREKER